MGTTASTTSSRPLRADAQRNRDALLAAAVEVYAECGVEASLERIARQAGVGIGTLYRHFPTRETLTEAVYRREVDLLCEPVPQLRDTYPPDEALATWMRSFARYVAHKRGMAMALKASLGSDSELLTHSRTRIREAIRILVTDAVEAGAIRSDVEPDDLLQALGGVCMAADPTGVDRTARLVDLLMDGLRYRPPTPPAR